MREKLLVTKTLKAPADTVWQMISEGTRVERWFPWVAETVMKDPEEGGVRTIRMPDGSTFDEYITVNDARTLTYQYYIPDPPLPVEHVMGTKRIERAPNGDVVLSWFVTFDVKQGAPPEIVEAMRERYLGAMDTIDELARR